MLHDFDVTLSIIDIVICLADMGLLVLFFRARQKPAVAKASRFAKYRRPTRRRRTGL